jgi:hypothetical protein
MVAMGGLDRFVGNETGPPQAAHRGKARERLSSTPNPSNQNRLGSVIYTRNTYIKKN